MTPGPFGDRLLLVFASLVLVAAIAGDPPLPGVDPSFLSLVADVHVPVPFVAPLPLLHSPAAGSSVNIVDLMMLMILLNKRLKSILCH